MTRYSFSPEFQRQLWIDFTPFRVFAIPCFVAVIGVIGMGLKKVEGYEPGFFAMALAALFCAFAVLWGCYSAGVVMLEEIAEQTWDFPRSSQITTAELAYGKLFGATAYSWYCALMLAALFTVMSWPAVFGFTFYYAALAALLGQAVSFLIALSAFPLAMTRSGRIGGGRMFPAFHGALVAYVALKALPYAVDIDFHAMQETLHDRNPMPWHGIVFNAYGFAMCSMAFLLFWVLTGAYRLMKVQLMYRLTPSVWAAFLTTMLFWYGGLAAPFTTPDGVEVDVLARLAQAFMLALGLCYWTVVSEAGDRRRYARQFEALRQGAWKRALQNTPKWMVTLPFVLGLYVATAHMAAFAGGDLFLHVTPFMLCAMLFVLRDGLVLHTLHIATRRKAVFYIPLYFLTVYVALPIASFMSTVKQSKELQIVVRKMFNMPSLFARPLPEPDAAVLFFPVATTDLAASILPPALQAALAALVLARILRTPKKATA